MMNQNEVWRLFCSTGSIEAYLLYNALAAQEGKTENDLQSERDSLKD